MSNAVQLLAAAFFVVDNFTVYEAPWWVSLIVLAGAALFGLVLFLILRRTLGKPGPRR